MATNFPADTFYPDSEILPPPMFDLDDSPRARAADPETSHEAADSNDVHGSKLAVLALLTVFGPMDDFEIERKHRVSGWHRQYSPSRLRTARSALVDDGAVQHTGYFHLSPSARRTRVWEVVPS